MQVYNCEDCKYLGTCEEVDDNGKLIGKCRWEEEVAKAEIKAEMMEGI